VVDVGGGHGGLLGAIAQRYPEVKAVLFESEQMLDTLAADPRAAARAARFVLQSGDSRFRHPTGVGGQGRVAGSGQARVSS
jgi:hypothetical protein